MSEYNPDTELDALFARARVQRPDTSAAEYAFETRLLARLREQRRPEPAFIWASVSWRLAPFFAAFVVGLTVWHSEIVEETQGAEQLVYVDNPNTFESWNGLN